MSALDTKFADMPASQRADWRRWANSHDWGSNPAGFDGDKLVTYCAAQLASGQWVDERAEHSTPRALRNWAGY